MLLHIAPCSNPRYLQENSRENEDPEELKKQVETWAGEGIRATISSRTEPDDRLTHTSKIRMFEENLFQDGLKGVCKVEKPSQGKPSHLPGQDQ